MPGTSSLLNRAGVPWQENALGAMRSGVAMSEVEAGCRRVLMSHLLDMRLVKGSVQDLMHKKIDR
jgi:hypothetical protein